VNKELTNPNQTTSSKASPRPFGTSITVQVLILSVWLPPEPNPYIGKYQDNEAAASQNNTQHH